MTFFVSSPVDTKTKEQKTLLSRLLASTDKEKRLATLEYLSKELHQRDRSLLPNSIQVDLANLLITESDHVCLVVALEMFVEVCAGLDICLLSYADLKILWNKLTSFAVKTCGVTVAGKAMPACSITLKYIINLTGKETDSSELKAMLSQWRELIEVYCQWEQDELLRLGTVQSLQFIGITLLWYVVRCKEESDLHSCFVETAIG